MEGKIFINSLVWAKHCRGLLGSSLEGFVRWMQTNGYSQRTVRCNIYGVTHFGKYLRRRGIRSIDQLEGARGRKVLEAYRCYCKCRGFRHRTFCLKSFFQSLKEAGLITCLPSREFLLLPLTRQYLAFLRDRGNLSESTLRRHTDWVENFLRFLGWEEKTPFSPFSVGEIDRFIEREAQRLRRPPHRSFVAAFRSFFRYLYYSGKMDRDLSGFIEKPRRYKLRSLPPVLTWSEVHRILRGVDRSTPSGLLRYAVLLLLTTYGLRAGEVARLKLEDIDWQREVLHIGQRKMGKDLWLPLVPQVGKAIYEYLRKGRPLSTYREVFLLLRAPRRPLSGGSVSYVVRRTLQFAGLHPPRRGAHLLRHSVATRLIRRGASLKEIGDVLGHRRLESTHLYTKTAIENLREVALEVPELKEER